MGFSSRLGRGLDRLTAGGNLLSAGLIFALMLLVVADVVGRRFLGRPVPMTFEIGGLLLVFVVFLALAEAQRLGAHIRVEFVLDRLPRRPRAVLNLSASLLGLIVYVAVTYETFRWAWRSYLIGDYVSGLVDVPKYPAQFVIPFGTALLCLQFAREGARHLRELR
jgi:TRAP-type C4-dicarboxylate transport system permease small subunit